MDVREGLGDDLSLVHRRHGRSLKEMTSNALSRASVLWSITACWGATYIQFSWGPQVKENHWSISTETHMNNVSVCSTWLTFRTLSGRPTANRNKHTLIYKHCRQLSLASQTESFCLLFSCSVWRAVRQKIYSCLILYHLISISYLWSYLISNFNSS